MARVAYVPYRHLLVAVSSLTLSTSLSGAMQSDSTCKATLLPGRVTERGGTDTYHSPNIQGGERVAIFSVPRRLDPLHGVKIVDADPSFAAFRLSNGSGLSFNRDCSGARCIYSGIKVAARATDCWEWLSEERAKADRTASGSLVLGGGRFIVAEDSRKGGRLLLKTQIGPREQWRDEPLIIGPNPIVGFGVGVPFLHAPFRTIDVIRRERDGSLSLATYVYKYR